MSTPADPGGTEPMFEIPEMYRPPKRRTEGISTSKWSKFTGRATCDLCILNVHDGITDTPLAKAKHKLTKTTKVWLLCTTHATQVRNGERKLNG